ncbi:Por secretion system C-terminal sorting domain-containing protein [Dyadobacter sp. SG02]|uniref:T9SS type A sorting domain-containing protein n=1 Tax=Dyadobacter sp. SG02 TaxID=1855291 RepID=UPI0008C2A03B|nr:T9SS type A sorting domain-containing protein [Dyadobacter sp. SG02]SEI54090.1 Por secretion system C-terminal sorting domain-containing protein [Dyadobacter sp. SG02]
MTRIFYNDGKARRTALLLAGMLAWGSYAFAQTYEAESGTRTGGADLQGCASCSAGQMVGGLGTGAVEIPVSVATAGIYNVTVTYCTGDQRTINVTPNGGSLVAVTCPASGGWATPAFIKAMIPLNAGSNTIRLDNPSSYGPNIDKITLTPINTPIVQSIAFGNNSRVDYDLANGVYDIYFNNQKIIGGAFATASSDQVYRSTDGYTSRSYSSEPVNDAFGSGTRHIITMSGGGPSNGGPSNGGQLEMQQVFYTYPARNYLFTQVVLNGAGSNCYGMSPLTSNFIDIQSNTDKRQLLVPFDNDAWVRYEARESRYSTFTGSEVGAVYDNTSRKGLTVGSVEHSVWKTGVNQVGEGRSGSTFMSVIAGWTQENLTRDKRGHGWVNVGGTSCPSPRVMISYDADWREGLDEYGKVNSLAEPRYIEPWAGGTPFGWNSWGAIQTGINLQNSKAVVDYFSTGLPAFRNADNTLYIDLDSYWDNMTPGSWTGDFSQLTEFANYCKSKGFKAGIYWAPFVDWGKWSRTMEGTTYNYADAWTKVNGGPIELDGAYALDPTHPGTKERIAYLIGRFKECGFEMIKLDFLAHASLEADSFYQSGVYTGMQAYKSGMEYLIDQIDGSMLVYAAISPNLATGRYAHMRRIACDAYSDTWESAYTLNSTNYGWWQGHIYQYIDGDNVVFGTQPENKNKLRLASSIITGTLMVGDDYSSDGAWKARAQALLQNTALMNLAKDGKAFHPVEGNTGWDPNNLFVKTVGSHTYLAVCNFGDSPRAFNIDLERAGLSSTAIYQVKELFSGATIARTQATTAQGTLATTIPGADVAIYELTDSALPVSLVYFNAEKAGSGVLLTWQTSSETDHKEFVVERGTNGKVWRTIGHVEGNGDSKQIKNYQFPDFAPVADSVNYYRLRQVDLDGTESYSRIAAVNFSMTDAAAILYPNPVKSELTVKANGLKGSLEISIANAQGRVVLERSFSNYNEVLIVEGLDKLPSGIYVLTIRDGAGKQRSAEFMKQ